MGLLFGRVLTRKIVGQSLLILFLLPKIRDVLSYPPRWFSWLWRFRLRCNILVYTYQGKFKCSILLLEVRVYVVLVGARGGLLLLKCGIERVPLFIKRLFRRPEVSNKAAPHDPGHTSTPDAVSPQLLSLFILTLSLSLLFLTTWHLCFFLPLITHCHPSPRGIARASYSKEVCGRIEVYTTKGRTSLVCNGGCSSQDQRLFSSIYSILEKQNPRATVFYL